MAGRVIVLGELSDRYEVERLLGERHPEIHVETVGRPWELAERAAAEAFDAALVLKGPITAHQERIEAIGSLRRGGFSGRLLYAGAFLTEKQDAVRAGADYAFDPQKQAVEQVVAASLYRPLVAADHPYLRYLFVGEWVQAVPFAAEPPAEAPDLLLVATSCHAEASFWGRLAPYVRAHDGMHCIVVEDDGSEDARTEALATGVQPYVVLAEEGLGRVAALGGGFLRERWLARVGAA
jgi:hypothetical protein